MFNVFAPYQSLPTTYPSSSSQLFEQQSNFYFSNVFRIFFRVQTKQNEK